MDYNLINVIAPLIGVLIGGLLTFFSTFFVELIKERRDRKKRKFLLKYELIGGIHSLIHYHKAQVVSINLLDFSLAKISVFTTVPNSKEEIDKAESHLTRHADDVKNLFSLMIELEERISRLRLEAIDNYKKLDVVLFNTYIDEIISVVNDRTSINVFDYDSIKTLEQLVAKDETFVKELTRKEQELVTFCETKKSEILRLFDES